MTKNQIRRSFSQGKEYSVTVINKTSNDDDIISVLGPLEVEENTFPLTEENLAIHTNSFPSSKEARCRQVRLFVEDQRPVVKMYLVLEKQRTQEMESFIPDELSLAKFTQQRTTKKTWLKRLAHWIHKRRHRGHHDICQKRDSGISFFSKHHSTRSTRIATVRQQNSDFAAYKYPKMVRNLLNHSDPIST